MSKEVTFKQMNTFSLATTLIEEFIHLRSFVFYSPLKLDTLIKFIFSEDHTKIEK